MEGFSKLSKEAKIQWLAAKLKQPEAVSTLLHSFNHKDEQIQRILNELSENTISNYHLPYGIAPGFIINGKEYNIPMVTEESSVIAAAASAAKFWADLGGFHANILSTSKVGQVHFKWYGNKESLVTRFPEFIQPLKDCAKPLALNMELRGGGIFSIELIDLTREIPNYYQLKVKFGTADSMGANFMNSCLEKMAVELSRLISATQSFSGREKETEIIMAILSNYNPDCLVETWVECRMQDLNQVATGLSAEDFASKMELAVKIAEIDVSRAVTHNKGIFNGLDAVSLATGNDFRANEAGGHAWASRKGRYSSLSTCTVSAGLFRLSLILPLSVGTVGGIINIHPLCRLSFEIMQNPSAEMLMQIMASVGLANHFSALRSLVTTGIQKGHMKMHLHNILAGLDVNESERTSILEHFIDKTVSYSEVKVMLNKLRGK